MKHRKERIVDEKVSGRKWVKIRETKVETREEEKRRIVRSNVALHFMNY